MRKKELMSEKTTRKWFLSNLEKENKNSNVHITFKYIINKEKLKNFQARKKINV